MRTLYCTHLDKEAKGLDAPPYPDELGQKIYDQISEEAWERWLAHQTMLINENRLNMLDPKARQFLKAETEKFLFGQGSNKPDGFMSSENT